ncbi:hypothetical protein KKG46_04455 [Patescibacteria group bacterium]|nr:hypothetical protein [Patescibacteria group bacterium]
MSHEQALADTRSLLNLIQVPNEICGEGALYAIRWSRLGYEWLMAVRIFESGKADGLYRVLDASNAQLLIDIELKLDEPPFITLFNRVLPGAEYEKYKARFPEGKPELTESFARGYLLMARFLMSRATDVDLQHELKQVFTN